MSYLPELSKDEHTDIDEAKAKALTRRVLWKLDLHILPVLTLIYMASYLDRANAGNAKIAGLPDDLHLHGTQFNTALTVFYVLYIVVEIPSNLVLKKVRANRWIPLLVFIFGVITTLTGLVQNFGGLITSRLMLGLVEGGLLPGIMLYLSTMYRRHELQRRCGVFFSFAALSGAFGALFATAILNMDGISGLKGWRWIFIIEGLGTLVLAAVSAYLLPADLASARFFTEEEREWAINRLRVEDTIRVAVDSSKEPGSPDSEKGSVTARSETIYSIYDPREQFEWREVRRAFFDLQTWCVALCDTGLNISQFSFLYFLPTILTGLGWSGISAQLHTSPPYVLSAGLMVIVGFIGDYMKWRGPIVLIGLPISILGYIIIICAESNHLRYGAVFLISLGTWVCVPSMLVLLSNNLSGHYKRATALAIQLGICNVGGFGASYIYTPDQAPRYIKGHSIAMAFLIFAWLCMFTNVVHCIRENRARAKGERDSNIEEYQALYDAGLTRAPIGDRHPAFRYTL